MTTSNSQTKKRNPIWYVILGFLALIILFILYILFASQRSLPTLPNVSILGELSGNQVWVGQAVIVQAIASDPDGISKAEFWVNDVLVGTQLNPDPEAEGGFNASQIWRPTDVGPYSVYVRAEDGQGYLGQSELVVLQAVSGGDEVSEDASQQVFAGEGDTLASLAETHGSTEEELAGMNPGLSGGIGAGASVLVPQPQDGEGNDEDDGIPQVGRPAGGVGGGVGEAAQASNPPGWMGAINPSWVGSICRAMPGVCGAIQNLGDLPPNAPSVLTVEAGEACQVRVSWTDNSDNENGFNLYRFPSEGDGFIGEFKAGEGTGGRFTVADTVGAGEGWYYVVAAVNQAGEASGVPSDTLDVECSLDALPGNALAVEIEALSMTVAGSTPADGQIYCYLSLMGNAHERIPNSPTQFFTRQEVDVDIAAHLGGENSRLLVVQQDEEVTINAECLAMTGDGPTSLGSFERAHPSEEWDGRTLSASSNSGDYTVTYRINGHADPMQFLSNNFALVDARIPPPRNLDFLSLGVQRLCRGSDCQIKDGGEGLFWDVPPEDEWPAEFGHDDIWGFNIYYSVPEWDGPRVFKEVSPVDYATNGSNTFSELIHICRERSTYYVSILVQTDAGILESPLSEGFDLRQDCAIILEITMERVVSGELHDGLFDDIVEAFGDYYIGAGRIINAEFKLL